MKGKQGDELSHLQRLECSQKVRVVEFSITMGVKALLYISVNENKHRAWNDNVTE